MGNGYTLYYDLPGSNDPDVRPMKDRKGRSIGPIRWHNQLDAYIEPYIVSVHPEHGLLYKWLGVAILPQQVTTRVEGLRDFYEAKARGVYPPNLQVMLYGRDRDLVHILFLGSMPPEQGFKVFIVPPRDTL